MSEFGRLNWRDFAKGGLLAILTAVYPAVQGFLSGGVFDWKEVLKFSLSALLAYLCKNALTDKEGKLLGKI